MIIRPKFFDKSPAHLVLIALTGLLAYSNTFNVPFQLDEFFYIRDNPIVQDLSHFLDPSRARGLVLYDGLKNRYVGYLSFALNYRASGLDVMGYHAVNISVHILNALLIYLLVALTFKTPFLKESALRGHSGYIGLFSALLFVSHPVQTEAVTYIFQRLASLTAFFYLLSIVSYTGSRLSDGRGRKYGLYGISLISAILAMKTKENAFTLPFVLLLYEFLFFDGPKARRALGLVPLLMTLLIIPLTLIGIDKPVGDILRSVEPAMRGYREISRGDYLLTQFSVVVTYIRLLFFPINQNFEYPFPIYASFFAPRVFLSFALLAGILASAICLYRKSRTASDLRLIAFGVFWFFITISVESSIIPTPMLIAEYRLYLPSAGVFVAIGAGAAYFFGRPGWKPLSTRWLAALAAVVILMTSLSLHRNAVWKDSVSLWEDALSKSPHENPDVHSHLGFAYESSDMVDKAIEHYEVAVRLDPSRFKTHTNLGFLYFYNKGMVDKAIEHFEAALRYAPDEPRVHLNLAIAYRAKGLVEKADEHRAAARRLNPAYSQPQGH